MLNGFPLKRFNNTYINHIFLYPPEVVKARSDGIRALCTILGITPAAMLGL